jgi:precorrin-3B C17-methyltransferase
MASALFEALEATPHHHGLNIAILPGITAMLAAAAAAGAPLGHDFCAINLSDNLKPFALIEHRLRMAARGDFAMGFYNPRSASRPHQFARVLEILREECGVDRLITFARAVSTPAQAIHTVTLAEATPRWPTCAPSSLSATAPRAASVAGSIRRVPPNEANASPPPPWRMWVARGSPVARS